MDRLSLNQITTKAWSLPEAVAGCARAGVGWIGLWRDKVAETGLLETAGLVREYGLRVSSLCRGGSFTGVSPEGATVDGVADTLTAIEEAAVLGAEVLVLVVGGIADGDLPGSRERVIDSLAEVGYASASIADITARAGVTRGAQLHHFHTRQELFAQTIEHLTLRQREALQRRERTLLLSSDRGCVQGTTRSACGMPR